MQDFRMISGKLESLLSAGSMSHFFSEMPADTGADSHLQLIPNPDD